MRWILPLLAVRPAFVWCLFFAASSIVQGQTHSIDSLEQRLAAYPRRDSLYASTLYRLCREYWDRDLDTAFLFAGQLLDLSERISYRTGTANAYSSMGVVRWYQGNYPEALRFNELAREAYLNAVPRNMLQVAGANHNLGLVHDDEGNYPEALRYYLAAMRIYDTEGNRDGAAQEHNAIAVIHLNQKDLSAALAENRKALAIRLHLKDDWGLTETYSNLGLTHAEMGNADSALFWYDKALELREAIDDQQGLAISYNNYSDVYMSEGRYAEAMESLNKALAINEQLGYRKSMASVQLNMGHVHMRQGDLRKALEHQKESLKLAEEVGATDYIHAALKELSAICARLGEFDKAYAYRLRYEALNDTIFNTERTRSLVRQEMNYGFAKKQLADSLTVVQAKDLAERDHQLELSAERNRRNLFALGAVSVLVLSLSLWSRLRYVRRTRDTILRTQQQLVASEKQREAEQVRMRIARDVHDEIGSELTKITLLIAETKRAQSKTTTASVGHLDEIAAQSRQVGASLNDIVWAVDPRHDSVQSLVQHAQHYAERMLDRSSAKVEQSFMHTGPDRPLDPATKRNIFLLFKEAVNNAVKYAKADRIIVALETGPDSFVLRVQDNGIGFDPVVKGQEGNGLRNMQARCTALGATLRITSSSGTGCAVEVRGPLP